MVPGFPVFAEIRKDCGGYYGFSPILTPPAKILQARLGFLLHSFHLTR
jgi:hypothetical protein